MNHFLRKFARFSNLSDVAFPRVPCSSFPCAAASALSVALCVALGTAGCGDERKKIEQKPEISKTEADIAAVANAENIDKRILLSAAYNQSNFANPSDPTLAQESSRGSVYGMPLASTGPIDGKDLVANTKLIAKKMVEIARASPPVKAFDWLVIASSIIVGQVSDDPNVRDLALRAVLVELVNTYNKGFSTISNGETIAVAPLPEKNKIVFAALDERQAQYINGYRFRKDFGSDFYLAGPTEGGSTEKPLEKDQAVVPKLLIIWCPGSNLICLETYRKETKTPVHFLATKSLDGQLETTQFYPIVQDLKWHGTPLVNTTIIAIAGQAGRGSDSYHPDWLDFDEYSGLRTIVRNIFDQTLRKFKGSVEADKSLADPATFKNNVVEYRNESKALLNVTFPQGRPDATLPLFWDSKLFWEILLAPKPTRLREQLLISQPFLGEEYRTTDVPFSILLTEDVRSLEIFQDANPQGDNKEPWELILKREVDPARRNRENFTHPFTRTGALAGNHRAVKIVARDGAGAVLTSKVLRFQVKGIEKK